MGRVNIAYMYNYNMHLYTLFISLCKYVNNIVGVRCLDIIYILELVVMALAPAIGRKKFNQLTKGTVLLSAHDYAEPGFLYF